MTRSSDTFEGATDRINQVKSQISLILSQTHASGDHVQEQRSQIERLSRRLTEVGSRTLPAGLSLEYLNSEASILRHEHKTLRLQLEDELDYLQESDDEEERPPPPARLISTMPSQSPDYQFIHCAPRRTWHAATERVGPTPRRGKRCPFCNLIVYRKGGSNHMTCACGNHWCWACGRGYRTGSEVYQHMHTYHGGCYTSC
jgi:hypothetical protein